MKAADDPIDTGRSFYEIIDAVIASVGKGRVGDELQRLFQPARPPTPVHRAIARLAKAGRIDNILTTNYDDILERALAAEGAPYVLQPLDRNDFITGEGVRLLKVHGSYDDWRSVVLSGRSYTEFGATGRAAPHGLLCRVVVVEGQSHAHAPPGRVITDTQPTHRRLSRKRQSGP